MKLTRRELAAAVLAQAPSPARPQPQPDLAARETEAARETLRRHATALDGFALKMETEPDFQFKA